MTGLRWQLALMTALVTSLSLVACDDEDTATGADAGVASACTPACDRAACEVCDDTGDVAQCVSACGDNATCQAGVCVGDTVTPPVTCEGGCGPCQLCDTSGEVGLCVDTCAAGTACVDGQCAPDGAPTCDPGCGPCQACDVTGDSPVCVDACGDGTECVAGACVAGPPPACEPGCDACQTCDVTGDSPVCVDACGDGTECVEGACVAIPPPACEPACDACQICDVSGDSPVCVNACGDGLECVEGVCQAPPAPACDPGCGPCEVCDLSGEAPVCVGTCGGTEICVEGVCRRNGVHANLDALAGPFENGPAVTAACLTCHQEQADHFMRTPHWNWAGPSPGLQGREDATTFGKKNLINNFCIAVPSNEARCTQCHAGYDLRDDSFNFQDATKIDCLSCHADTAQYAKAPTLAGNPAPDLDLVAAARSVNQTTTANCGSCHFSAGGGDNVKKGDLGSNLLRATREDDVHMGRGLQCANCHAGESHNIMGRSVHNVATTGRVSCTDCHDADVHANPLLNNHAQDVACQTCHVPAFSRAQPTKMNWDWATAGDRTRGANGVEQGELADGTTVTTYDAMKGDFVWMKNVRPEYGWWDGRAQRMTITDQFPEGAGGENNPIVLGRPVADIDAQDALIWPFKVMRGRQAIDPVRRLVIVPKLFGPGGFWPRIPAADAWSAEAVEALWAETLTTGARVSSQIGADESYGVGDWAWGYTEMWMGINHEVAPAARALDCGDCHNNPAFDFEALGYSCDPMMGGAACGSRH